MSKARTGVTLIGEYARGQVAVAAIADDRHDDGVLDLGSDLQRDPHCATRGNSGEDPFLARHAARDFLGIGLTDFDQLVDTRTLVDLRQVSFGPFAYAGDIRSFRRLRADDADAAVALLQVARYAH